MIMRLLGLILGLAFIALCTSQLPEILLSDRPVRDAIGLLCMCFISISILIYGLGGQALLVRCFPFFKPKWWKWKGR